MKITSGKYKSGQAKKILVFDLETIPDYTVCWDLLDIEKDSLSPQDARKALQLYHTTSYQNDFPRQLFHQIVAFSYALIDVEFDSNGQIHTKVDFIKTIGDENSTEKEILESFFAGVRKMQKHVNLVTFNGRTFDIPVLKYRAMKHGISADWLMDRTNKWDSYNKNEFDYHCDLLDALSDFGASAKIKLLEVCALLKIPVKIDVSGGSVLDMHESGNLTDIRNYCETDVVATYLLYLNYVNLMGHGRLKENTEDLINYMVKEKPAKAHFQRYLDEFDRLNK